MSGIHINFKYRIVYLCILYYIFKYLHFCSGVDPLNPSSLFNVDTKNPSFSDRIISNSLQSLFPPQNSNENINSPLSYNKNSDEDTDAQNSDNIDNPESDDADNKTIDEPIIRPKSIPPSADLSPLTEYRRFFRRTTDGRLCAAAFIQDEQTYTDCTNATAPDGSNGIEWCYVEVQLINKGTSLKDWAECEPPIDYDRIRSENTRKILEKFELAKQMTSELELHNNRLQKHIAKFKNWDLSFQSLSKTMEDLNELLSKSTNQLNTIKETGNKITLGIKEIQSIDCKLEKALSISSDSKHNCKSPSYTTEHGITGTYYQGHGFTTNPLSMRLDRNINFHFFGPPIEGLSPYVFSIKWSGYLIAPHTGHFILTLKSSGYAKLVLEDAVLIELVPGILAGEIKKPIISDESGIDLIGGNAYSIEIDFISDHRYHLSHSNDSSISLFWKSTSIPNQPIPHKSFVTKPLSNVLHLSISDGNNFSITTAENGISACFESDCKYDVIDIPQSLIGHKLIRVNQLHKLIFNIRVNIPCLLYVAHQGPFPITFNLDDQINTMGSAHGISYYTSNGNIKMNLTAILLLPSRDHTLHMINTSKEIPNLLLARPLYGSEFHPHNNTTICGPNEILTLPGGRYLNNCKSSSNEDEYDCMAGLSNVHTDAPYGMWHSKKSYGVGEYIELYFKNIVQIRKLIYKPRDERLTWPSKLVLHFKPTSVNDITDEPVVFNISHTNDEEFHHYELPYPSITNYVRIEIGSMYLQNMESGGSFTLIGGSCHDVESIRETGDSFITVEKCNDNAESVVGFPWIPGSEIILSCPICDNSNVSLEPAKDRSVDYSINSPPCIAAQFFCSKTDTECRVLMLLGSDGFSVMKLHPLQSKVEPIKILFGSRDKNQNPIDIMSIIPKGYYADQGQLKSKIGDLTYGWLEEPEFDILNDADPLVKYGIKFPKASEGWACLVKEKCRGNYWSIDLENGDYQLTVYAGSRVSEDNQEICLQINHVTSIHETFPAKSTYKYSEKIRIKDNLLVISSYCLDSDLHTTIRAITLFPISD